MKVNLVQFLTLFIISPDAINHTPKIHFALLDKEGSSAAHGQLSNIIGTIVSYTIRSTCPYVTVTSTTQIFC